MISVKFTNIAFISVVLSSTLCTFSEPYDRIDKIAEKSCTVLVYRKCTYEFPSVNRRRESGIREF